MFKNLLGNKIASTTTEPPKRYTQLDDGTFQEQLDIIYAPSTVFYTKSPDGSFAPATATEPGVEDNGHYITEQYMIDTSIEFLRAKGYIVAAAGTEPIDSPPVSKRDIEASMLLDQLRGMAISHVSNRGTIDDMCMVIAKIKALV